MSLNSLEQVKSLLEKANNVLLIAPSHYTGDQIATGLAWYIFFLKQNKKAEFVIEEFQNLPRYDWLLNSQDIKSSLSKPNNYCITLDISQTGLQELSYDVQDNFLKIFLTPKNGIIIPEDLSLQAGRPSFDLIITLGSPDLNSLGSVYHNNRDLFFQTPIINIDHQVTNENYGTINAIDLTVASIAEVSYGLIKYCQPALLDKELATCLLTGVISATNSFRTISVNPQTLQTASELMNLKADREKIAKQLFQTKTVPLLNLWGKILSRLDSSPHQKIIWSELNQTETDQFLITDITSVIDELILQNPNAELALLFIEKDQATQVIAQSQGKCDVLNVFSLFTKTGSKKNTNFMINKPLAEAKKLVLQETNSHLPNS